MMIFQKKELLKNDISKEGIIKDLQAMKKAGIGAALIGNINPALNDDKVPMLTEDWWLHMVHAVVDGKRIGVESKWRPLGRLYQSNALFNLS